MFWYHATTKHSYNSVRTNPNYVSWKDQPDTYKTILVLMKNLS